MKKIIILALSLLMLTGCSHKFKADKHIRKANKHIAKAESFGAKWHKDTVYQKIEVVVPKVSVDTVFKEVSVNDTITITKDRLTVKYVKLPGDSVFLEGECRDSIIYRDVPIVVNNELTCPPDKWKLPAIITLIVFLVTVAIGAFALFRRG